MMTLPFARRVLGIWNLTRCVEQLHVYTDAFTLCTGGYATWFTAGGAIRIAYYDVIDDVITRNL